LRFSARIFLTALLLTACCLGQSRSPDDGSTQDNVYTNFFFQLRYPFTASWVPQPPSAAEELQQAGEAKSESGGTDGSPANAEKSYYLLTLFRTIPGQGPAGRSRAIITLVANDNASHPEITSGKEAVVLLTEKMKQRHYTPMGAPQELKLSGQSFFRQDMKATNSAGVPVYQSMVFTVTKGYALGFLLVSPTKPLLDSMLGTLDSFKFY
jgi:hypothetical protein